MNSGSLAEDLVVSRLRAKKLKILHRNERFLGVEVDIVAADKRVIYLVEVKLRKSRVSGDGFDAVSNTQLQRLEKASNYFSGGKKEITILIASVAELTSIAVVELREYESS